MGKGIKILEKNGVKLTREEWMTEAELCEKSDSLLTCRAIIRNTVDEGLFPEQKEKTLFEDADHLASRGHLVTARAIVNYAIDIIEYKKTAFLKAIDFEKK